MRNKILPWLLAGLAVSGCTVMPEQANIDGKDVKVVFMHTSDIHSRLLPYNMDVLMTDKNLGLKQEFAPFGGVARLASVIKQERQNNPRLAYIESGDVFQGAPIFNTFHGEPEFKAMSQLGVDAFAIGNHEFDNGAIALVGKALQYAAFPMLGANYALGDPSFPGKVPTREITEPYTIVNLKGLRVGIIGMAAIGGGRSGGGAKGVTRLRDRDMVQAWVDYLRPMVDLVAITSHVGYHEDIEYIPRTEGLDIVFGGHLHIALDPPNVIQDCDIARLKREMDRYRCDTHEKLQRRQLTCESRDSCKTKTGTTEQDACKRACAKQAVDDCKQEEKTFRYQERMDELKKDIAHLEKRGCHPRDVLLVHSGAFLKFVGKLEVTLRQCQRLAQTRICAEKDASGKCVRTMGRRCVGSHGARNDWEVISHKYRLIPVDSNLPEDTQMVRMMEPFELRLNQEQLLTQVIGFTPNRIFRFSKGAGDSQLGNMVTSAMMDREQVWADCAITNSLGMRSDLVAGPVDEEQLNNVFPFENSITVMYLAGYEIQEMMDFVAQRSSARGCQPQAQVSGISATLNCGGCPGTGGNTCALKSYSGEPCAQRVTVGGSGRACTADKDCELDPRGRKVGEICTKQKYPGGAGKGRCWLPLSCSRTYRLATNDYVAKGGSGFAVLANSTTQNNLKIPLRDAAKDYITSFPACAQILQTIKEREANKAPSFVVGEVERKLLRALEAKAKVKKQMAAANAGYKAFHDALSARLKTTTGAENAAINAYLACVDEKPDPKDGRCLGLACRKVIQCTTFKTAHKAQCEALGRIRAALRCITIPCIQSREDGRIQRLYKDASSSPHWNDPFPE